MMICRPTIQPSNHPLPRRQREKKHGDTRSEKKTDAATRLFPTGRFRNEIGKYPRLRASHKDVGAEMKGEEGKNEGDGGRRRETEEVNRWFGTEWKCSPRSAFEKTLERLQMRPDQW